MRKFGTFFLLAVFLVGSATLSAQTAPSSQGAGDLIQLAISTGTKAGSAGGVNLSSTLQILLLFTVLSIAPSILIMTTSFVRIVVVLSFLRTSLGLQQPSNQIVIALALFLTSFIMAPAFDVMNREALQPMRQGKITTEEAFSKAVTPLREFMLRQMRAKDLELFTSLYSGQLEVKSAEELPLHVIIPSFMLAELKTAFQMGVFIMLPFLVIDLVVSSILMTLGMMMLPPPTVSLPIKIMVFVLVDGWTLVIKSLVSSFSV